LRQITKVLLAVITLFAVVSCVQDGPRSTRVVATHPSLPRVDRGAYDVVERWNIDCAGRGGFGERVVVRSHKTADLKAAYDDFIAGVGTGSDQCLYFAAFTTKAYALVNKADIDKVTSAQVDAMQAHSLVYLNNPNPPANEHYLTPDGMTHQIRGDP
jgi:hypothetical protein